jgi:hypothetical protein
MEPGQGVDGRDKPGHDDKGIRDQVISAGARETFLGLVLALIVFCAGPAAARAESHEIRFVQTYGLAFLPLHVAIENKLIE